MQLMQFLPLLITGTTGAAAGPQLIITPQPQHYAASGGDVDVRGWAIGASSSTGSLATQRLANATNSKVASGGIKSLPSSKYIAVGMPTESTALAALAKAAGLQVSAKAGQKATRSQSRPTPYLC